MKKKRLNFIFIKFLIIFTSILPVKCLDFRVFEDLVSFLIIGFASVSDSEFACSLESDLGVDVEFLDCFFLGPAAGFFLLGGEESIDESVSECPLD